MSDNPFETGPEEDQTVRYIAAFLIVATVVLVIINGRH